MNFDGSAARRESAVAPHQVALHCAGQHRLSAGAVAAAADHHPQGIHTRTCCALQLCAARMATAQVAVIKPLMTTIFVNKVSPSLGEQRDA